MDQLKESDLSEVYERVFYARARWYNIGLKLNIPCSDLEVYRNLSSDDALRDMLRYWLRRTNPAPTWSRLIEALRSPTVREPSPAVGEPSPTVGEHQPAQKLVGAPEQRGMLQGKLHIIMGK